MNKILKSTMWLLNVLTAAGCSSGGSPSRPSPTEGPIRPAPTIVSIEPLDLTTSVGSSPMQIVVSNWSAPVGPLLLGQISRSIRLKTWPELTDVSLGASTIADATGQSGQDEFAHIYLTPTAQLAERWYALSLDTLPKGVTFPGSASLLALKNGGWVARFRVGSQPVLAGVSVHEKPAGKSVLHVEFSEPITGDAKLVSVSYVGGGSLDCQTDNNAPSTQPTAAPSGQTAATTVQMGSPTINFVCATIDLGKAIQVDIQPGLRSTAGPAVAGGSRVQLVIQPFDWISLQDGGMQWKPAS
jgi:hypothetical protein